MRESSHLQRSCSGESSAGFGAGLVAIKILSSGLL